MKKTVIKSVVLLLMALIGTAGLISADAQKKNEAPKVYAVINKADWCHVCQANGSRVMSEVIPACKPLNVKFIPNDLTNEQTIAKSSAELKKANIYNSVKDTKSTGLIIIVDARTKKVIKKISVTKPTDEIISDIINS